ncbi:MAG: PEP-CTERM sorting domain-containing protein [Bryobacteraceae bacterium]|jgi:hypothetical protein
MGHLSKSICKLLVSLGAVALFAPLASATIVTYSSSAAFEAATNINLLENYGTLTDSQLIGSGSTVDGVAYSGFVLTNGATNLEITNQFQSISGLDLGANHTVSGPQYAYFLSGEGATIGFSAPVTAFGIFFDMDISQSASYGITNSNGDSFSVGGSSYDTKTFAFAGLTSTKPFTSVKFFSSGSGANYAIPEFEAKSSVPEPASAQLLLAGVALLGAGLFARRRSCKRPPVNAD